jgi:hypothetical protein
MKRITALEIVLTVLFLAAAFFLHKGVSWLVLGLIMVLLMFPAARPDRWTVVTQLIALVLVVASASYLAGPTAALACLIVAACLLVASLVRGILMRRADALRT